MKPIGREIIKHSGIYGIAQIVSRFASLLMLPIYTRYLTPADYGCIAILDLTSGLLATLIVPGLASAVNRHHFEARDELEVDRVWWTGLSLVALLSTVLVLPAWLSRDDLARLTLGADTARGGFYFALTLATLWLSVMGGLPDTYLRVRKRSGLFLLIALARLTLNVGINVYFLVVLRLGITGVLVGNLIATAAATAATTTVLVGDLGRFAFSRPLASELTRFGAPLTIGALLSLVMHNADRYLLRVFVGMDRVGIYSVAYSIAQGIAVLFLQPFLSIWGVVIYEIAEQSEAKRIYALVFRYCAEVLLLLVLGVSLFARPVLALVATSDYGEAADLIPIIGLGYALFSLHRHFEVPALLAKRTVSTLPANLSAVMANLALNLALVPTLGIVGAAWASVLTYATYSFVGLWRYRRIDRYDYPLARCGMTLMVMMATYLVCRVLDEQRLPQPLPLVIPALAWTAWAIGLFGPVARPWFGTIRDRLAAPAASRAGS